MTAISSATLSDPLQNCYLKKKLSILLSIMYIAEMHINSKYTTEWLFLLIR